MTDKPNTDRPFKVMADSKVSGETFVLDSFESYEEARDDLRARLPEYGRYMHLRIDRPTRPRPARRAAA